MELRRRVRLKRCRFLENNFGREIVGNCYDRGMNLMKITLLGSFVCLWSSVAFAQYPQTSGQNTASGSIAGAPDNPPLQSDDLSIAGPYANGLGGSNSDGSWSVSTGGEFAHRGVAVGATTNVSSFNEDASVFGRGYISYTSYDVLTFDAEVPFTLTFRLHGSTGVSRSGDTQPTAASPLAKYSSTAIVKDPDVDPDTFSNVYGGTNVGSISLQANGFNLVDTDSNTFTATINPGQGLIFSQNVTVDTGHTADAEGVGTSGEWGEITGSVSGGIDLLSFEIGGIETDSIMVLSQSGENYFAPIPEPLSVAFLFASVAGLVSVARRRRN